MHENNAEEADNETVLADENNLGMKMLQKLDKDENDVEVVSNENTMEEKEDKATRNDTVISLNVDTHKAVSINFDGHDTIQR